MRFPDDVERQAFEIIEKYSREGKRISTAESCTGGMIAAALTSIAGASKVFERGFISYSNEAKVDVLGVLPEMLNRFGAVSPEIAEEMAVGALTYSHADVALSVTGIAGPTGGSDEKPVGYVCFGLAIKDAEGEPKRFHTSVHLHGDRNTIRYEATLEGLHLLLTVGSKD